MAQPRTPAEGTRPERANRQAVIQKAALGRLWDLASQLQGDYYLALAAVGAPESLHRKMQELSELLTVLDPEAAGKRLGPTARHLSAAARARRFHVTGREFSLGDMIDTGTGRESFPLGVFDRGARLDHDPLTDEEISLLLDLYPGEVEVIRGAVFLRLAEPTDPKEKG